MELQTRVKAADSGIGLAHSDRVLLLGSCFSDNMGRRMRERGFDLLENPFGTMYNPLSMAECLRRCEEGREIGEEELVLQDGLWHSWLHHGAFSNADKEECMRQCNQKLAAAHEFLSRPTTMVLTFGTAFVYRHQGRVVGNCHKVPAREFERTMLSVEEIVEVWAPMIAREQARGGQVVVTVSPIRHLADTAHGNMVSKATLLLACERLEQAGADYFPSYEIMMDELRDYRFYDRDMVHPSELAVDLIWERFEDAYCSAETRAAAEKFLQLHKMKAHRPLYPESEAYKTMQQRIEALENELETYKTQLLKN